MKSVLLVACLVAVLGIAAGQSDRLAETRLQFTTEENELASSGSGPGSGPERVSGFFRLSRKHTDDAEMFYFYFENRNVSRSAPVVLWLTGGPGCSSELAVFKENGPYELAKDGKVTERKLAWDQEANMIFVDQPLNVGFSYSEDPDDRVFTEEGVAADLKDFLEQFFLSRPHLADNDFYVTGESYAGHYVPAVAAHILETNKAKPADKRIKLAGIAIGNGLTDPGTQYGSYSPYAEAKGLISSTEATGIQATWPICKAGISMCNSGVPLTCDLALYFCQATQFAPILAIAAGVNIYDVRKECVGPLCYDFSDVDTYLNLPETRKKLGVPEGRRWQECDMDVNGDFHADFMRGYGDRVAVLLEAGLPVLIYAGAEDLICNLLGQELWTTALEWSGRSDFNAADKAEWSIDGEVAGYIKSAGNFTQAAILDAGHMVPMDQPARILELFAAFVTGRLEDTRPAGGLQLQGPWSRSRLMSQQ